MRDSSLKRWSSAHRRLFRATGGRLGKRLVANNMLLLTSTGRTTGKTHTVPLLYLEENDLLVVIASYGGRDRYPDWYLNLAASPEVVVELPGQRRAMIARTATPDERARWWPRIVDAYDGYAVYQAKTKREIPVVLLEPAG